MMADDWIRSQLDEIADKKAAYYKDIDTVLVSGVGKWIVEHGEEGNQ